MSDEKKAENQSGTVVLKDERGLSPASSGTPMPKVKPAKPVQTTTGQKQNNTGNNES